MEEKIKRTRSVQVRLSQEEFDYLEQKFRLSGYKSKSEFMRIAFFETLITKISQDVGGVNNAWYAEHDPFVWFVNYEEPNVEYSISPVRGISFSKLPVGQVYQLTLIPTGKYTGQTVINAFDHEITVDFDDSAETDAKLTDLENQVMALQSELSNRKIGDLNGDGIVNASDAALTLIYAAYSGAGGTLDLEEWLAIENKK